MLSTSPKMLKHLSMISALALTVWAGTALAQSDTPTPVSPSAGPGASPTAGGPAPTPVPGGAPTTGETDTMEHYLTNHPKVADELHNDPSLINNPQWLAKHPVVQNWMNNHQNVKADAASNPKNFVNHTEHETLNNDRRAMNNTDEYLSKHPALAKQLNENPRLIDDPKFLAAHPSLDNYLKDHPGTANEWKSHPEAFADAARADERYNKTGQVPRVNQPRPVAKK
jgi:hypothetical protein